MAEAASLHLLSANPIINNHNNNVIFTSLAANRIIKSTDTSSRSPMITCHSRKHAQSLREHVDGGQEGQQGNLKAPRRLITLSPSEGRWQGKWNSDYIVSLRDLNLQDLVEDGYKKNADVSIQLSIEKHASFGLSVEGRIVTSLARKCSTCFSPYCRQIDTNFTVWILPSSRDNRLTQLQEIGGDDPSVIYVRPGYEANLDSLIQDTIRLTASAKDTCSESCEKSEPTLHYIGEQKTASMDKRWARLLELKNSTHMKHKSICLYETSPILVYVHIPFTVYN